MREMKDSGIEWIGEIPKDWDVIRVKQVASGITDGTHGTFQRVSEGKPLLSAKNVFEDGLHIAKNESLISEEDFLSITKSGYPQKDDILLCCVGTIGRCMLYTLTEPNAFQRSVVFIRPNSLVLPGFLKYAIQCDSTVVQEYMLINQSAQAGLYQGSVKELKIPLPQKNEQKVIANFLDGKCAEIDALTSDIESQIDMLEQYKRSVITEAVTKGLNPDAEMKDSGVEWIGLVPKSWDVKPIRAVFEEVTQKNKRGEVKNALKFTYGEIVPKSDFDADDDSYVADTILNYTIVKPGTIMLNGLNLNYDFVTQRVGLVKEEGVITSAYMAFKAINPSYMLSEYATYLFKSYDICKAFHNMGGGVRKILNFNEFKRYYVLIPPVSVQQAIIAFLDGKCSSVDAVIADKQAQLETLAEYKKSLIYEYVTGKKEAPTS